MLTATRLLSRQLLPRHACAPARSTVFAGVQRMCSSSWGSWLKKHAAPLSMTEDALFGMKESETLIRFDGRSALEEWQIFGDSEHYGSSRSTLKQASETTALWSGTTSLVLDLPPGPQGAMAAHKLRDQPQQRKASKTGWCAQQCGSASTAGSWRTLTASVCAFGPTTTASAPTHSLPTAHHTSSLSRDQRPEEQRRRRVGLDDRAEQARNCGKP